jgi:hypothetical protein
MSKVGSNWQHLSSFDVDGVYAEINDIGEVRVNDTIYRPKFDIDSRQYVTTFIDQLGEEHDIDTVHFIKVHFNKDLKLMGQKEERRDHH